MKLWKKIALVCTAVLLLVIFLASGLLLLNARNNILLYTVENAKDRQRSLAKSFANMAAYSLSEEMSASEQRSVILRCFETYAEEYGVLVHRLDTLYSYVDMQPQDVLFLSTPNQRVFLDELGSRNLLIVGSLVTLLDPADPYAVYVVQDISDVYEQTNRMTMQFLAIALAAALFGTALIMALVRRATRPLKKLQVTARHIADGEYGERADIHTSDEVGELSDDFNRMAEAVQEHIRALEEKNERQELFINGVTHEFKTPMTSMMLHSETLLNMRLSDEQRAKSLQHIRTQCVWLEHLIQKLLALIALDARIKPVVYDVGTLFEQVRQSVAETLGQRGTPLEISCEAGELTMDPELMQSLLINLVDNASKASEPGQRVLLRSEGRTLSVQDHGRGIPQDAVCRVTEPFYMVDRSRSKKQGGSGLGLALCKRIADAHGAEFVIESALGEGTTISIVFPPAAALRD